MICPLCGKRVVPTGKNAVIVDGHVCHRKCPNSQPVKPKQQDPDKKLLIDEIYNQFALHAKGYIKDNGGFNHMKLLGQIEKLHDNGYSYTEQLYALNKVVESQGGFYGYTAVVNKIASIIARKRLEDEVKQKAENHKQETVSFDLGKLMKESDDEW